MWLVVLEIAELPGIAGQVEAARLVTVRDIVQNIAMVEQAPMTELPGPFATVVIEHIAVGCIRHTVTMGVGLVRHKIATAHTPQKPSKSEERLGRIDLG